MQVPPEFEGAHARLIAGIRSWSAYVSRVQAGQVLDSRFVQHALLDLSDAWEAWDNTAFYRCQQLGLVVPGWLAVLHQEMDSTAPSLSET